MKEAENVGTNQKRTRIKYIGYYDVAGSKENREYFLSATNFMDYISETLVEDGYEVEYISMSHTKGNRPIRGSRISINSHITLKKFFSIGKALKLFSRLDIHLLRIQMFLYLLFRVKSDDIVLCYHSLNYAGIICKLKKIKKIKLILQVTELYQDVNENISNTQKQVENKVIKVGDAYLFSNEHLRKIINTESKPSLVVYGKYNIRKAEREHFADEKVHVVYAGTLDPRKGGMIAALAGTFLNEKYHMHILGFGSENQIKEINGVIENNTGLATVTFDGLLSGEEFDSFLSKCQIGLCTQIPDASFAMTSFPSKILTYMSCGLDVVSSRVKIVEESVFGQSIHFYDDQSPYEIAKLIMTVSNNGEAGFALLQELHLKLLGDFKELIHDVLKKERISYETNGGCNKFK